jgi:glycosyltransferase involved in cell wall biosynthesis
MLVSDSYPPLIGGAGRDTELLAAALVARGHRVCVATSTQLDAPARETSRYGFEVHRLPGIVTRLHRLSASLERRVPPPFPDPETVLRLRRLIRRFRPDVVHSYGWMTYSCLLALAGLSPRLIVSARDYGMICATRTLLRKNEICDGPRPLKCLACASSEYGLAKGTLAVAGTLSLKRRLARRCSAIHSVSRYMDARMVREFLPAEDPARGRVSHDVIRGFASETLTEPVDHHTLVSLPREPYILYVGALRLCKGVDVLIDAYARLRDPPPLVLLGPRAPDTPSVFPGGVRVLPATNHATVMRAWDGALFAVAPSRLPEPFGNVVHEAMSRGRAVIGTHPGGHEDMIDSGRTGLLVPTGDLGALTSAMRFLLEHPTERNAMGALARAAATRSAADSTAPAFEALYRRALARG